MEAAKVAELWEGNAETWTQLARAGFDVYRDALNTPAFLAMLPPIGGLSGLDVGCGEGSNTRQLARLGAKMQAIDIAPTFIRHAREMEEAEPLGVSFQPGDAMALPFPDKSFDFVTAFMCLMDIPDQQKALREVHRVLRPGGFLQFSILHPCFAPPHRKVLREQDRTVRAVEVARYFDCVDEQVDTWLFSTVPVGQRERYTPFRIPFFHRTLSAWIDMICRSGLVIEQFTEPSASREVAEAVPTVADTRVVPLTLIMRVRKAA